jgi:hypothetical protein
MIAVASTIASGTALPSFLFPSPSATEAQQAGCTSGSTDPLTFTDAPAAAAALDSGPSPSATEAQQAGCTSGSTDPLAFTDAPAAAAALDSARAIPFIITDQGEAFAPAPAAGAFIITDQGEAFAPAPAADTFTLTDQGEAFAPAPAAGAPVAICHPDNKTIRKVKIKHGNDQDL